MCYFIISYYMYIHNRDFFLIFMYICYYKLYLYKPFVWKASFQRREDVQTRYRQSAPANWWLIKFWSGCWCACAVRFYVRYAVSLGPFSVSRKGCVVANPTTGRRYFFISVAIGGITLCAWPLLFVFVRTCNARRPWYAGTNYFTPARAVYAVVILCVLSWDIGHQSVDDTAFRSYYLIYLHIYIARGCDPTKSPKGASGTLWLWSCFSFGQIFIFFICGAIAMWICEYSSFRSSWQQWKTDNLSTDFINSSAAVNDHGNALSYVIRDNLYYAFCVIKFSY